MPVFVPFALWEKLDPTKDYFLSFSLSITFFTSVFINKQAHSFETIMLYTKIKLGRQKVVQTKSHTSNTNTNLTTYSWFYILPSKTNWLIHSLSH